MSAADGSFSIDRLPPGKYTLEAWHEKYGTATQEVTIETGKTADVTFTFDGKVAANVPMAPVLLVLLLLLLKGVRPASTVLVEEG